MSFVAVVPHVVTQFTVLLGIVSVILVDYKLSRSPYFIVCSMEPSMEKDWEPSIGNPRLGGSTTQRYGTSQISATYELSAKIFKSCADCFSDNLSGLGASFVVCVCTNYVPFQRPWIKQAQWDASDRRLGP